MGAWELPLCIAAAGIIHLALLAPALGSGRFADDWQFVFDHPWSTAAHAFATRHPYTLYRPIQLTVAAISMALVPDSLVIAQVVTLLLHLGLIAMVLLILARIGVSRAGRIAALLFLSTTQLAANAAAANDTLSLVLSTVSGVAAAAAMVQRVQVGGMLIVPFFAFLLALLGKESGLGYAPVLMLIALKTPGPMSRGLRLRAVGGVVVISALYLAWRGFAVGAAPPDSRLFGWGLDLPRNVVQLWLAALLPWRITSLFTAVHTRESVVLAAAGVALLGFVCWIGVGLHLRRRLRAVMMIAALATLSVSPVLFMRHVSQLYAYALLPALAIAVAWACEGLGARRALTTGLVFALLQAAAQRSDAEAMASNGVRGEHLMRQLRTLVRAAPQGAEWWFADRADSLPDYSVFRMTPFRLAQPLEAIRIERRQDLRWRVLSADSVELAGHVPTLVRVDAADIVTLDGARAR